MVLTSAASVDIFSTELRRSRIGIVGPICIVNDRNSDRGGGRDVNGVGGAVRVRSGSSRVDRIILFVNIRSHDRPGRGDSELNAIVVGLGGARAAATLDDEDRCDDH